VEDRVPTCESDVEDCFPSVGIMWKTVLTSVGIRWMTVLLLVEAMWKTVFHVWEYSNMAGCIKICGNQVEDCVINSEN
jgi:hypothetical protein